MRIAQVTDEAPGVKTFRLEFVDERRGRGLHVPHRPVRRVLRLRRGREHLLHRLAAHAQGLHRVHLPPGRPRDHAPWPTRERRRHRSASAAPTATSSRSRSGKARTCSSSPAASPCRRMRSVIWNCLDLRDRYQGHHHRLRRPHRGRPRLQARAGRVGRARRREAGHHRRSRRRDARLEGRDRLRAGRPGQGRPRQPRTRSPSSAARRS